MVNAITPRDDDCDDVDADETTVNTDEVDDAAALEDSAIACMDEIAPDELLDAFDDNDDKGTTMTLDTLEETDAVDDTSDTVSDDIFPAGAEAASDPPPHPVIKTAANARHPMIRFILDLLM